MIGFRASYFSCTFSPDDARRIIIPPIDALALVTAAFNMGEMLGEFFQTEETNPTGRGQVNMLPGYIVGPTSGIVIYHVAERDALQSNVVRDLVGPSNTR